MKNRRWAMVILAGALLALAPTRYQQQGVSMPLLKGYLDKMGLRYVPHPRSADAVVVPRTDNQYAERLDLYVEIRQNQQLVLTAYAKSRGKYFSLARAADREKLFQRLLEANHRSFSTFFVDDQGDIGARFTFTTENGVGFESFRMAVLQLMRIADEYTPVLDSFMRKD